MSAMSSYEFEAISNIETIAQAHAKRGFRVVLVGEAWTSVQALAKRMGVTPNKADTLVVTSLARQIHERQKTGADLFDQNTFLVVGDRPADLPVRVNEGQKRPISQK